MIQGKTVFITGGAGFIGSHLAENLAAHNKVILYDNFHRNAIQFVEKNPNITIITGDILDVASVRKALETHKPNIIVHMAAIAGVQTVVSQPAKVLKINLIGTYNVLTAIVDLKLSVERFVDFSTSEVYGPSIFEADEEGNTTMGPLTQPRWYYALSKLASEYLTHSYYKEYHIPTVSIRPFNVYGPRQVGEGAISNFIANALAAKPLIVHNNGTQIRSWCYIDDFIQGLLLVLEKPEAVGHTFNIGNPQATVTNLHLAKLVTEKAHSTSPLVFQKIDYPEITLRVPNVDKARRLLGFEPKVSVEEGVANAVAWAKSVSATHK
jgi:UDP-glucuronate decarboxylase